MRHVWLIGLLFAVEAIAGHAQQAAPPPDAPIPIDQWKEKGINPPKPLNKVEMHLYDEIRQKNINGRCLISLTVDINGMPQDIQLVRSTDPAFGKICLADVTKFRFSPETTQDGKAVSVKSTFDTRYRTEDALDPIVPIRYAFKTPPGVRSTEPDADGVYPLTKLAIPPLMIRFSDDGYEDLAFSSVGNSVCTITLTISAKGKPSDPQVVHCERPTLEQPVIKSLLDSQFKPGMVNGKTVRMRAAIQIELGDFPSN